MQDLVGKNKIINHSPLKSVVLRRSADFLCLRGKGGIFIFLCPRDARLCTSHNHLLSSVGQSPLQGREIFRRPHGHNN